MVCVCIVAWRVEFIAGFCIVYCAVEGDVKYRPCQCCLISVRGSKWVNHWLCRQQRQVGLSDGRLIVKRSVVWRVNCCTFNCESISGVALSLLHV